MIHRKPLVAFTFLAAVLFIVVFRAPVLLHEDVLGGGDVNRGIYWMQKWNDPALFQNDPISDYLASTQPPGMVAVYRVLSFAIDPVTASGLLAIPLFLITAVFLYLLVLRLSNPAGASFALFLFMGYEGAAHIFSSSTGSDFMPPLFCAMLFFLVANRWIAFAVTLTLSSFFYPAITLVCATVAGVWRLREQPNRTLLEFAKTAAILIPAGVTLVLMGLLFDNDWGAILSRAEMTALPAFGPGGDTPFVNLTIWEWLSGFRSGFAFEPVLMPLFALSLAVILIGDRKSGKSRNFFGLVLLVCLAWFALAHLLAIRIGFPTNYVRFSLPILLCAWCGAALGKMLVLRKANQRQIVFRYALIVAVILFLFAPHWTRGYDDFRPLHKLHRFLRTLPKDDLIMGSPNLLEGAPALTARKLLVSRQAQDGLHRKYLTLYQQRMEDFLAGYYATSRDTFCDVVNKYGVAVVVVDRRDFDPTYSATVDAYSSPYREMVQRYLDAPDNFYLLNESAGQRLFSDNDRFVIRPDCVGKTATP